MHKFRSYRESIDIDYFVYFTKAYFAFNAYLKAKYPAYTDIDKIKKMKDDSIGLSKFSQLIYRGKHFKDDLVSLRDALDATIITNNGEQISFNQVKIGEHTVTTLFSGTFSRISYDIRAIDGEKFTFNVNGIQYGSFKYEDLESTLEASSMTDAQKNKVRDTIILHVSNYSINLSSDINSLSQLSTFSSMEQTELIKRLYRGFIEILYKLRNGLFHSEVEPNLEVMKVYKFAYFILRKILHEIPGQ